MQRTSFRFVSIITVRFTHSVATDGTGTGKATLRKMSRTALSFAVTTYKAR